MLARTDYSDAAIQVMQPYKGYFISASAMPIHPFSPDWYVGGSVLVRVAVVSIVEVTRFQFQRFTVSIKELAEWFGVEVARDRGGRIPVWTNIFDQKVNVIARHGVVKYRNTEPLLRLKSQCR